MTQHAPTMDHGPAAIRHSSEDRLLHYILAPGCKKAYPWKSGILLFDLDQPNNQLDHRSITKQDLNRGPSLLKESALPTEL
jgi:hypothetical protein